MIKKFIFRFILITSFFIGKAQSLPIKTLFIEYKNCKNKSCQIKNSFLIAEYYLEEDNIYASQKWLDIAKNVHNSKKLDTTAVFIHSLQSELFYYNGLFQFGVSEAEKVITNSFILEDSLLISNGYFFKGINLLELNNLQEAQKMLWKSRNYQPTKKQKKHIKSSILKEHVYNNLAQLKLQLHQSDSAIWYNSKAYNYAKKSISKRGIPNIEQIYGQIYLKNKKTSKAIYYLKKSIISAQRSNYNDIVLSNYGYLMLCYPESYVEINKWFDRGKKLIEQKEINTSYQVYFYKTAIKAFRDNNLNEQLVFAQERLIQINEKIALSNNNYIQNITKQYLTNENRLLKQELNLTKSTKEKEIFYALVSFMVVLLLGFLYFFKQRQKLKNQEITTLKKNQEIAKLEALIDGEEKERKRIAQELHDGLNGDLSAIKYRLSTLEDSALNTSDSENLAKVIGMIDDSCAQVRSISHNLMPTSIIEYGMIETIRVYLNKINTTENFKIHFQTFGNYIPLSKKIETIIYRIIQELVTNILKHSKATEATIQFNYRVKELVITIEDNGIGFDTALISNGIGLKNIQTRIEFLNAHRDVDSSVNGTFYTITIDLKNK
jgi:signal transduction histidine kinase